MSKARFNDLIETLRVQFLPQGKVELLDADDIEAHPVLSDLPFLTSITKVQVEKDGSHFLLSRVSEKMFLNVSARKENCNLGILISATSRIAQEIRDTAMQTV